MKNVELSNYLRPKKKVRPSNKGIDPTNPTDPNGSTDPSRKKGWVWGGGAPPQNNSLFKMFYMQFFIISNLYIN